MIPFGARTFSVPLSVTATVDGDTMKLSAHGTLATSSSGNYGETDFAVTTDETAEYGKDLFSGSTVSNEIGVKTQLKKNQGVSEQAYRSRYYVSPSAL